MTYLSFPYQRESNTVLTNYESYSFFLERKAQGITLAAAKYSSEDAAVVVEYIISLVEYTRLYKPYKKALEYLEDLIKEKEEDEKRAELEQLKQDLPSRDVSTSMILMSR